MNLNRDQDTICAVSTPHGRGGISVIRVSGEGAPSVFLKLAPGLQARLGSQSNLESHRAYLTELISASSGDVLDQVVATYFGRGRSFTGEETIEISCHGSPVICESIIQELVEQGVRIADRGEFTYRSFMNGNLDLVQAEAVLATIESQSNQSTKVALRQLKGRLSSELVRLEDSLIWCQAHIEAGIDFSTEGLETVASDVLIERLTEVLKVTESLLKSYHSGRLIRDGIRLVFAGLPNVGKSSLLNVVLEKDRAIVSDIAGTTRDVVEGDTTFDGLKFSIVDTAGLRETVDRIEALGVQRSIEEQREADLVFYVIEANQGLRPDDLAQLKAQLPLYSGTRFVIIQNKCDLLSQLKTDSSAASRRLSIVSKLNDLGLRPVDILEVSSFDPKSRQDILSVAKLCSMDTLDASEVLITQSRHFECLLRMKGRLIEATQALRAGVGEEFVALGLREALVDLQKILGKQFDDEIMDRVFKEFCIGK